ncbi:MAG TPA: CPXCG motif-containing cysteine-rich protein [Chromatiales bacterium]|nr:CPXCG motif-containing cysteine-rich protein [Chromatiales bacterium]
MAIVELHDRCPWCGGRIDLTLDENAPEDDLLEECPHCGRPIDVQLRLDENGCPIDVEIRRDDGSSG